MKGEVEIIAHRGASADAPENTLAAFNLAWEQGADAIECDVQLSKDNVLMVIHDDDTRRTTGNRGKVSLQTSQALNSMDAGRWKHARWDGETLPTLAAVLASVPEGKRIFVEIKAGSEALDPLVSSLESSSLAASQTLLISFDAVLIEALRRRLPDRPAGWIVDRPWKAPRFEKVIQRAQAAGIPNLCFSVAWPLTASMVNTLHEAGLGVYIWTVDDPRTASLLIEAGVNGIITNVPGRLIAAWTKSGGSR